MLHKVRAHALVGLVFAVTLSRLFLGEEGQGTIDVSTLFKLSIFLVEVSVVGPILFEGLWEGGPVRLELRGACKVEDKVCFFGLGSD